MNKELLNKLAELRIAEREVGDQIDSILLDVNAMVVDVEKGTPIKVDAGVFTVKEYRSWTYPEAITTAQANLKAQIKEAEQVGSATYTIKKGVSFKENDNNKDS